MQYAVYFDYTGGGRGPEVIAGPFDSEEQADEYLAEQFDPSDKDYFVDEYHEEYDYF